jgi:putative ABC transport system permease protein
MASLVVRPTEGAATALVPAIRSAAARVDRNRPLTRIRTLDDVGREATSRPRFRAVIVGVFASVALVLALVGVFGVLAQSVEQRRREFGVRVALGASPGHVLGLVFGTAARIIAAGTSIGLVLAAALGMSLTVFLFGVRPLDPLTLLAVPALLALTAAVAAAIPALRAMRVDPVVTFRNE